MKGVQYLTDDKDKKVAVQIDLKLYGDLWEDFYDILQAETRKNDKTIPFDELVRTIKTTSKTNA